MARSDSVLSIKTFFGINDNVFAKKTRVGEARSLCNFVITDDGKLKKRKGFKVVSTNAVTGKILQVIDFWTTTMRNYSFLVLTDGALWGYRFQTRTFETVYERAVAGEGRCFEYGDKLYLIGGEFVCFDRTLAVSEPEPYIPTLYLNKSPLGNTFETFEKENMLTDLVREEFLTDSSSKFYLKYKNISDLKVYVGELSVTVSPDNVNGTFTASPPLPTGMKAVATYRAAELSSNREELLKCRRSVFYGGVGESDLFLWSGDSNKRYYSNGGNITYFPIDNCDTVGEHGYIGDIVCYYDRMVIFTSSGIYSSELHLSENGDVSYPVTLLNSSCKNIVGNAAVVDNSPVFINSNSIKRIESTAVRSEKNLSVISDRISGLLRQHTFNALYDVESRSELWMTADNTVVIWNYKNDVFYTFEGIRVGYLCERPLTLTFFDTDGYYCEFTEDGFDQKNDGTTSAISAYCYLEGLDFGSAFRKKQLNDIFVKTEKSENVGGEIAVIGDISEESSKSLAIKGGLNRLHLRNERFYTLDLLIRSQNVNEALEIDEIAVAVTDISTVNRK
ncbi:MAG: hypothetical protein IJD95_03125 [Clostridia bacterium]|nr:hypothetical protein [Clostridia bacterium]